jgi:hypothetical protein
MVVTGEMIDWSFDYSVFDLFVDKSSKRFIMYQLESYVRAFQAHYRSLIAHRIGEDEDGEGEDDEDEPENE